MLDLSFRSIFVSMLKAVIGLGIFRGNIVFLEKNSCIGKPLLFFKVSETAARL